MIKTLSSIVIRQLIEKLTYRGNSSFRVVVLGAGKTGHAVANALSRLKVEAVVLDQNHGHAPVGCRYFGGVSNLPEWERKIQELDASFAISSPGIAPASDLYALMDRLGIGVISELDFSTQLIGMPVVAVTGTNGKTTTVELLGAMIENSVLLGNIGTALSDRIGVEASKNLPEAIVAEVSSYQLATSNCFHPHIGLLLNVEEDHLEWHQNFEAYFEAKLSLFNLQSTSDWAVVINDRKILARLTDLQPQLVVVTDSPQRRPHAQAVYDCEKLNVVFKAFDKEESYCLERSLLRSKVNLINSAFSIAAARIHGVDPERVQHTLDSFKPLKHRLERVPCSVEGVTGINDSKATNPAAVSAALETLKAENRPIILLLGGKRKLGDWAGLFRTFPEQVKQVICFGADAQGIAEQCPHPVVLICKDLETAVEKAKAKALKESLIVLSPGCASFDKYRNYEERGDHFTALCKA